MTAQRWNQALVDLQAIRSPASISCCKQQMPHIASNIKEARILRYERSQVPHNIPTEPCEEGIPFRIKSILGILFRSWRVDDFKRISAWLRKCSKLATLKASNDGARFVSSEEVIYKRCSTAPTRVKQTFSIHRISHLHDIRVSKTALIRDVLSQKQYHRFVGHRHPA
jgi:hypothetical protein